MRSLAAVALIVAVIAVAGTAHALDPLRRPTQYRVRSWSVTDGLPQSSARALAQTRDGYLWVGTDEGLARFDGVRFEVFDRGRGLRDPSVSALLADADGSLWVGTRAGGLHHYQGGALTPVVEVAADAAIADLAPARDGGVWVASNGQGLFHLRGAAVRRYTTREGLVHDDVDAVAESADGRVWIGTSHGLSVLRGGVVVARADLPREPIVALRIGRRGEVWVALRDRLLRVDGERLVPVGDRLGDVIISSLLDDRDGNLWIGVRGRGLLRHGDGVYYSRRDGLPSDNLINLLEDREGNLWIGLLDGLVRLSDTRLMTLGEPEGLKGDLVWAVLEARDGAMWFATHGGGLLSRAPTGGAFTLHGAGEGVPGSSAWILFEERRGALWVGASHAVGMHRREPGAASFAPFLPRREHLLGVTAMAEEASGRIWFGSSFGVARLDGEQLVRYRVPDGLPADRITDIAVASDGVWFATTGGLARFAGDRFQAWRVADGLPSNEVVALRAGAASDGGLWLGTNAGLVHRHPGGRFTTLTVREGLCEDTVNQILDDGKGGLWMGGNHGISRVSRVELEAAVAAVDPAARHVTARCYGNLDGMRVAETSGGNQPAGWVSRDGRLWFPTARGVTVVDPARLPGPPAAPPVLVEAVQAEGLAVDLRRPVSLPAGHRALEVRYTGLALAEPERVRFRYQLEGFDKDWIDAGARRVAYYTNLPSGSFHFRLSARSGDGVWGEAASLPITLEPRLDERLGFRVGAVLVVLLLLLGAYQLRIVRLKARQRELTGLVEERTVELRRTQAQLVHSAKMSALGQLVAGVAHELNNPVNFITVNIDFLEERYRQLIELIGLLERRQEDAVAQRKREIDYDFLVSDSPALLGSLRHGAQRIAAVVDNLRQFSRASDSDRRDEDLAEGLRATLRLLGPLLGDHVHVHLALDELPRVRCSGGQINQVFMNLLVNAVHAMGARGDIHVTGRRVDDSVEMTFRDTGPGVPVEIRGRIFEPFFTTKPEGQGTGIGLSISHRIVADHHGTLDLVDSPVGEGATFRLRLPLSGA